jgi:hypothetical protein
MKCTCCATDIVADARFCPQCGQPTQGGSARRDAAVSEAAGPEAAREQAKSAAEANASEGAESIVSGKVMTSPFPPLPDTPASLALPGKKLSGSAVHALLAQANLNRMRRQYDEAIDCCVSVLRAQPANQSAHVLLGDVYRDQRRWDDAIQWYGMAVDLRPNPTDQAKLEQVTQERERTARLEALRVRRGYGNASAAPIDRGTDLNTGTVNLMGVSPRRWLRGITVTSLAFAALVLIGLVWNNYDALMARWRQGRPGSSVRGANGAFPASNGFGLPPHRNDRTQPSYLAAQAANGDKTIVVGGSGMPPDRNTRPTTVAPQTPTVPVPNSGTLPPNGTFSTNASASGMTPNLNVPPAPVESLRPLSVSPPPDFSAVAPTPQPSNRLTDGMQVTQTVGDGGVGATVLMTGAPSLMDGDARGQDIAIRNAYRAARTAFAGNNMLTRVKVLVQTQVQGAGQAVVMEAELERGTALNANPDTDSAGTLQGRLLSYRWTGIPTASQSAPPAANEGGTP